MNIYPINACDKYLMGFLLNLIYHYYINTLKKQKS